MATKVDAGMSTVRLDLENLSNLLADADRIVRRLDELDDVDLDPDLGPKRRSDPAKAEINHTLLHLQTILTTASSEAGMQYWRLRGRPDARYEDSI